MTWYVVVDPSCIDPEPGDHIWTVSRDPNEPGWVTDGGFRGYGLTKADAEELASAANAENAASEARLSAAIMTARNVLKELLLLRVRK